MVIRKDSEQTNYTCLKVHSDIEMKEEREKKKKKRERERERERESKQQSCQSGKPLIRTRVDSCSSGLKVEHVTSVICSVRQRVCLEMLGAVLYVRRYLRLLPAQLTYAVEETCLEICWQTFVVSGDKME